MWPSLLSPSKAAVLRSVELCGFIYISNSREETISVQEIACGPAPAEVHLKALKHSQGCRWSGQLCPWASTELRRKQNYCRGRRPWDGFPPLLPGPSAQQQVTGISHLLIAKLPKLIPRPRPAWKGCHNVPEGTAPYAGSPCADGLAVQQDTSRAQGKWWKQQSQ